MWILIKFFHFYFLAKNISLNIVYWLLKFVKDVENITLVGTLSQICYLGPSFYFI